MMAPLPCGYHAISKRAKTQREAAKELKKHMKKVVTKGPSTIGREKASSSSTKEASTKKTEAQKAR